MLFKERFFLKTISKAVLALFVLGIVFNGSSEIVKAEEFYKESSTLEESQTEVWDTNKILGQNGEYTFAGIYEYDNLTIGDNVTVFSSGISQLVIKVKGTLTLGKNVAFRVRSGAYKEAPTSLISSLSNDTINNIGVEVNGFRLYDKMYGKGGDGGNGGRGTSAGKYGSSGGGGGAGGFGGGVGGTGGAGAAGTSSSGQKGSNGSNNGGRGGNALGGYGGSGGEATGVGANGTDGSYGGNAGGGGGGNGGDGGIGKSYNPGNPTYYIPIGGSGGGGGGYGGGILTIIAETINYDYNNPPKFLVSGQVGGKANTTYRGENGENGEGGLLIVQSSNYIPNPNQWKLDSQVYGTKSGENGHGQITGNPQKVFINEKEADPSDITAPIILSTLPEENAVNVQKDRDIEINYNESILKGFNFNYISVTDNLSGESVQCNSSISGSKLTIQLLENLSLNRYYTVRIPTGAVVDSIGNSLNTDYTFSFKSQEQDNDPPVVRSSSPYNGEINVEKNRTIKITFSENVFGDINYEKVNLKNKKGENIEVDKTIYKNTLTLTPKAALNYGDTYTVTLPAASVKDVSNNPNTSAFIFSFSTVVKVTGISLSTGAMSLIEGGGNGEIKAFVTPAAAQNKEVLWSSDKPEIAAVNAGVVTPLAVGNTVIKAETIDGGYKAYCFVSVKAQGPMDAVWKTNQTLGQKGDKAFAGVYEFDSLYIGDNVTVTNTGTSQLVIKVNGTLTLGKNANIRVRNGYYAEAPQRSVMSVSENNLETLGYNYPQQGYTLYENMYGKGGNGGNGGNGGYGLAEIRFIGLGTYMYISGDGGCGGGGGAGGFGGGFGGYGGLGGKHQELTNPDAIGGSDGRDGSKGQNNGGNGGNGAGGLGGTGGGANNLGNVGDNGGWNSIGMGGGGGGGNGASGLSGDARMTGSKDSGDGGGGGGAGGYGGGILTIIADKIVYDKLSQPKFIVSGQRGGSGGGSGSNGFDGTSGEKGDGGLLIIKCKDYAPSTTHWSLKGLSFGNHDYPSSNGGHGVVTGDPQKVFINGVEIQSSDTTAPMVTSTTPQDSANNIEVDKLVTIQFSERIVKGSTNFSNIAIINSSTGLPIDSAVSIEGNIIFIKPLKAMDYKTTYRVNIPSGAVVDYVGNGLAVEYNLSFTTAEEILEPPPYGDFNNNNKIDSTDMDFLADYYNVKEGDIGWDANLDINKDGIVDIYDIVLIGVLLKE